MFAFVKGFSLRVSSMAHEQSKMYMFMYKHQYGNYVWSKLALIHSMLHLSGMHH